MSDVLVLAYHAVSDRWPSEYCVRPDQLEEQLRNLLARGYRGATFLEAVTRPPAPRTLAVTFDDAHRSVVELGLPVLSRLGLRGTVFACTDFVGGKASAWAGLEHWLATDFERELDLMSWEALGRLAGEGWEIGSHTCSHRVLTELDAGSLAAELQRSKADCEERLGISCETLAYPYGEVDERVVAALRAAGYAAAGALIGESPRSGPLRWPRLPVYLPDGPARFKLKTARAARRLRGSRGWAMLRPVNEALRR
jgi:peptidoglycan/xylan/chitin deacetylase (PgdA/CDA1 family)